MGETIKQREDREAKELEERLKRAEEEGDKLVISALRSLKSDKEISKEKWVEFNELMDKVGGEKNLKKECIKKLREFADFLEETGDGYPHIYSAEFPKDPIFKERFIDGITVVASYPWPG